MWSQSERLFWADRRMPEQSLEPPPDPADDWDEPRHYPGDGWRDSFGEWHDWEEDENDKDD